MPPGVVAAVQVAIQRTELDEFPYPQISDDAGLMKVESAGVCGSDTQSYRRFRGPAIMGHENVGEIVELGPIAASRWGVQIGDRVSVEEYLPCWHCRQCRRGEFRLCAQASILGNPDSLRYGYTSTEVEPRLWGGFSQFLYLAPNAVIHRVADHISSELATLAVPISNGIQWACADGGAGPGKAVAIFGPGQQGLGCALAAKAAGADTVILIGTSRDSRRLAVGKSLGADVTIDVDACNLRDVIAEITSGDGVDVVVDTTSDATGQVADDAIAIASGAGATVMLNGSGSIPNFSISDIKRKYTTVRAIRGHSHESVERALAYIGSRRWPLELMCTHRFGLAETDAAISATAGIGVSDAVHVTVEPWHKD